MDSRILLLADQLEKAPGFPTGLPDVLRCLRTISASELAKDLSSGSLNEAVAVLDPTSIVLGIQVVDQLRAESEEQHDFEFAAMLDLLADRLRDQEEA